MGKENAGYKPFLLFPHFQKVFSFHVVHVTRLISSNVENIVGNGENAD